MRRSSVLPGVERIAHSGVVPLPVRADRRIRSTRRCLTRETIPRRHLAADGGTAVSPASHALHGMCETGGRSLPVTHKASYEVRATCNDAVEMSHGRPQESAPFGPVATIRAACSSNSPGCGAHLGSSAQLPVPRRSARPAGLCAEAACRKEWLRRRVHRARTERSREPPPPCRFQRRSQQSGGAQPPHGGRGNPGGLPLRSPQPPPRVLSLAAALAAEGVRQPRIPRPSCPQ